MVAKFLCLLVTLFHLLRKSEKIKFIFVFILIKDPLNLNFKF